MAGKRILSLPIILGILGVLICLLYWKLLLPPYLTFSDAAKFADIARNLVTGREYGVNFTFFGNKMPEMVGGLFPAGVSPFSPFTLAILFKIFGITDFTVILTSGFFYLTGAVALYFLGKKIFGNLVGILASLAFIFDPAMLNYATSGASETLFIFLIIFAAFLFYCAATNFIYINTKVSLLFGFLTLIALYFTRQSAIIYIFSFVLFFILLKFKKRSQILKASGVAIFCWIIIELFLINFSGKYFLYSPISSLLYGTTHFLPTVASTATLRGGLVSAGFQLKPFLSKLFYNLYNFYKLVPQILSPYLVAFYFMSFLRWEKEREKWAFRLVVLFMVVATFIASAAFLPIYRYLHPVIPFVYLLGAEMLVWILGKMFKERRKAFLAGLALIMIFIVGQTTGKIFLDSRYLRAHTNQDKPPVYVKLAWLLKENTNPDDLVITNLDTWGSWYGERKTIWFPLQPEQLIPEQGRESKIDAIYLTSYKMDDENYFMGEEWREMFYQPEKLEDSFFAENFELAGKFEIEPEETYEWKEARAILLKRKKQ